MRIRISRTALLALVAGAVVVAPVAASFAQDAERTIKVRRAAMKELSTHNKAIAAFLKGTNDPKKVKALGTLGDMEIRVQAIAGTARRIVALFPKGTGMNAFPGKKTGAKVEIWSDAAGFKAAADKLMTLAAAAEKAAASGDEKAFAAAFGKVGKDGCGGCHKTFRQKLN
jgi:cytochrome c556